MNKEMLKKLIERFSACKYCDDVDGCSYQNTECFKLRDSCLSEIVSFLSEEWVIVETEEDGNEYSDYVECPYCGCRHDELDRSREAVCSDCGKRFAIHKHEMYTTSKMIPVQDVAGSLTKKVFRPHCVDVVIQKKTIRRINE